MSKSKFRWWEPLLQKKLEEKKFDSHVEIRKGVSVQCFDLLKLRKFVREVEDKAREDERSKFKKGQIIHLPENATKKDIDLFKKMLRDSQKNITIKNIITRFNVPSLDIGVVNQKKSKRSKFNKSTITHIQFQFLKLQLEIIKDYIKNEKT